MPENKNQLREHIRVKIQTLAKEGFSTKEISQKLKVGRTTVFKWKNNKTVIDKKRSGRPRVLTSTDKKQIKSLMYRKFGSSIRKTTKTLNMSKRNLKHCKKISPITVHNYLKTTNWGRKAFRSTKKPLLSKKNDEDRKKLGDFVKKQ